MFRRGELGRALGVLEPQRPQAGPRERPEVRPHRVDVLVDPELLLVLLLGVRAAPVRARACPRSAPATMPPRRVTRASSPTIARRSSAWWSVATQNATSKLPSANGQPLAVGLDAQVRADALLEEAPRPSPITGSTTRSHGDVLAAERHEVLRRPALRRADLEHAVARARRSGRAGAGSRARSRAQARSSQPRSRFRNGSAASMRSSASYQPCSRASTGHASSSRSFASMPGRGRVEQAQDAVARPYGGRTSGR